MEQRPWLSVRFTSTFTEPVSIIMVCEYKSRSGVDAHTHTPAERKGKRVVFIVSTVRTIGDVFAIMDCVYSFEI